MQWSINTRNLDLQPDWNIMAPMLANSWTFLAEGDLLEVENLRIDKILIRAIISIFLRHFSSEPPASTQFLHQRDKQTARKRNVVRGWTPLVPEEVHFSPEPRRYKSPTNFFLDISARKISTNLRVNLCRNKRERERERERGRRRRHE